MHDLGCRNVPLVGEPTIMNYLKANRCVCSKPYFICEAFIQQLGKWEVMRVLTYAKIDTSRVAMSAYFREQRNRTSSQSSHPRPILLMAYFVYARMRINRVATVNVIAVVNVTRSARL